LKNLLTIPSAGYIYKLIAVKEIDMATKAWRNYGNRMLRQSREAEFGKPEKKVLSSIEYIIREAEKADYHKDETDIRNYTNAPKQENGLVGTKKTISGNTVNVYKSGSGYTVRYPDGSKDWFKSLSQVKGFTPLA
jgi:hypothetical protein